MAASGRARVLHFTLPTMALGLIIHITLSSEPAFDATEIFHQRCSEVSYVSDHDIWYLSLPIDHLVSFIKRVLEGLFENNLVIKY